MRRAAFLVLAALAGCASPPPATPAVCEDALAAATPGGPRPADAPGDVAPGASISDVGLPDPTAGPFVVIVASSRCSKLRDLASDALRRAETFGRGRGVRFVYLYADPFDAPDAALAFHRRCGFQGAPIVEDARRIARALGAVKAAEAFVVGADGVLRYRGAVERMEPNGRKTPTLEEALRAVLAGTPVATPTVPVPG